MHSFMEKTFTKHVLYARHHARHWGHSSGQSDRTAVSIRMSQNTPAGVLREYKDPHNAFPTSRCMQSSGELDNVV